MALLLDTHAWLWLEAFPERLSASTADRLADPATELHLSAASAWEIAIKYGLGKVSLPEPPEVYVPSRLEQRRIRPLAIQHVHALAVAALPLHHRDPFDRLLVAQAQVEGLPIVTADRAFDAYDVEIVRAST